MEAFWLAKTEKGLPSAVEREDMFFDLNGIVQHEFLPRGQTVNKEYYLQVQRRLREAIRKKRSDL